MKTGGIATKAMFALFGLASCNFDAAFNRYCDNNPRCQSDAGPIADMGPDVGQDVVPDFVPDVGPGSEVNDAASQPAISPPKTCASLTDCSASDEVCHPISQVCVKTCNGPTDCPAWLGSCSDIRGGPTTRGPKVCSCTFQSCNNYSSNFTCNPSGGLCERACGNDQDCLGALPPRTCDLPTGLCVPIAQTCSVSSDCPPMQPRCDPTSLVCTECVSSTDCAGRSDGGSLQCGPAGGCVGPQSGP
jgi:hypothetical protein